MTPSDPFERHGIDHISPSSLRLYKEAPAAWIGKYLLKAPDEVGPGAWRGLAVEAGVDQFLYGQEGPVAVQVMQDKWDSLAMGQVDPDVAK